MSLKKIIIEESNKNNNNNVVGASTKPGGRLGQMTPAIPLPPPLPLPPNNKTQYPHTPVSPFYPSP